MKMNKEKELPKRKPTRLRYFDYNASGAYFITICTENRRQILSHIVGGDVAGVSRYSNVEVFEYTVTTSGYYYFQIDLVETVPEEDDIYLDVSLAFGVK